MYINLLIDLFVVLICVLIVVKNVRAFTSEYVFSKTTLIYLSGASIVSLLISFSAISGRIFIVIFYVINLLLFIYNLIKKKDFYLNFLNKIILYWVIVLIFFMCITFYSLNFKFLYNGHDSYFFAIPFEISEALYNSRLKIFDSFPKVWSKYHFFHGSFYSFFTIFALSKNIFLFKAIKVFTLFILYKSLNEIFQTKKLILFSFYICLITLFSSQTSWFLFSNGILSLYLLVVSIKYIFLKKHLYVIICLLLLSNSSIRNFLPSLFTLGLYIYINKPNLKISIKYLLPVLILISAFSMVLSGNINSEYTSLASFGDINLDFMSSGWFKQLILYKVAFIFYSKPYLALIFISITSILFIKFRKKNTLNMFTIIFLILLNVVFIKFWSDYIWIPNFINLIFLLFILYFNKNSITQSIFRFSIIYILVSCFQLFIIPPDSAIVNIMLLELLVFSFITYLFIKKFSYPSHKLISLGMVLLAFVTIFRATYRYSDNDTIRLNVSDFDLNKLKMNKIFKYENAGDYKEAAISTSLLGKRVETSPLIQPKYHVSNQFTAD